MIPPDAKAPEWSIHPGSLVYVGNSMYPTFKAPEMIYFITYGDKSVRQGDVIVFDSPVESKSITHRVISVTSEGIRTRGDNNRHDDEWTLQSENITGQVILARRGKEYRRISGGRRGELDVAMIRISRFCRWTVFSLIVFPYRMLAPLGIGRKWFSGKLGMYAREVVRKTERLLIGENARYGQSRR